MTDPPRPGAPPSAVGRRTGAWVPACALALMVASDYKVRLRSANDTLAGGADIYVMLEIAVYGIVAGYLLLTQPARPRISRTSVLAYMTIGYVVVLVIASTYSPYRSLAVVRAMEMVILLSLVLRIQARAQHKDMHLLAHCFLVLVAGSTLFGVLLPSEPVSPQQVGRFTWLQVHPITAGVYLGLATLIALNYLAPGGRSVSRWPRKVYLVLLMTVGGGLIGTHTRSAVLGFLAGALVMLFARADGRSRVALGAGVATVGALLVVGAGPTITAYFARGEDAAELTTLNSRTGLWAQALEAIEAQPLFGYGLSASRGLFLQETGLGGGHNALINVGVDVGAVGLALWLGIVLCSYVRLLALSRDRGSTSTDRSLLLGVLTFLVVNGFFFEGMGATSNVAAYWLFLIVAWTLVLHRCPSAPPAVVGGQRLLHATKPDH